MPLLHLRLPWSLSLQVVLLALQDVPKPLPLRPSAVTYRRCLGMLEHLAAWRDAPRQRSWAAAITTLLLLLLVLQTRRSGRCQRMCLLQLQQQLVHALAAGAPNSSRSSSAQLAGMAVWQMNSSTSPHCQPSSPTPYLCHSQHQKRGWCDG